MLQAHKFAPENHHTQSNRIVNLLLHEGLTHRSTHIAKDYARGIFELWRLPIAYIDLKMLLSQSLQRLLSNITITIDAAIDLVGSPKQTEQQQQQSHHFF